MSEFSFTTDGSVHSGPIVYREGNLSIEIPWEWSGNPNYDICFSPIELRWWDEEHQLKILYKLRQWLKDQNMKSTIDLPSEIEITDRSCVWANCSDRRIKGSAYCLRHYDLNLLRA